MGFVYDNSITIPNNKTDGNQPSVPTNWVAADANLHANALLDVRTAIQGGDYFALRDMSGGLPDVSSSGAVQLISNAGVAQVSSNGAAYRNLFPGFATQTASFTLGVATYVACNATSGNIVATLPAATAANSGVTYTVYKSDASVNTVTLGASTLSEQLEAATYLSTGSAWVQISSASSDILPNGTAIYDIRSYGAVPGASGKTATTAAFNAIFAEISYGYFPSVSGKLAALIYVPAMSDDGWYVGDLNPYIGSPSAAIHVRGDMESGRGGLSGSTIIFDGTLGGTFFDFEAINQSTFENLTFNGNSKAKIVVQLRQYWNVAHSFQAGTSGVRFNNCFFHSPQAVRDSILVAIGKDDDPPNTLQTSEIRFYNCYFQGDVNVPGYGAKALNGGNTKNFTFDNCSFGQLYQGIHTESGYLICREVDGGNIGYDGDKDACMIWVNAQSCTITGGSFENGGVGYLARYLNASGQAAPVNMTGTYMDGIAPADDYLVSSSGLLELHNCELINARSVALSIAWAALSPIRVGQQRVNDTNKWYVCTVAGTTGNAGGPTGTGSGIVDGSVHWDWAATGDANIAKVLTGDPNIGGVSTLGVSGCTFPYITTPVPALPVYDGSNNLLGAAIGTCGTDYAKSVAQLVHGRGNKTGLFGGLLDESFPDFDGQNVINSNDQMWNDNLDALCTTLRNDSGVCIITVPASAVAAAGAGHVPLGNMPAGYRIVEAILDVTTLFSGPAVTGIKASLGNTGTSDTGFLTAAAIDSTGQIGIDIADRGADWNGDRYIIPFGASPPGPLLTLKVTVTGGSIAAINAGSLNVYLKFQRLRLGL